MDHTIRVIPGFYYDFEKKKYFKIQSQASSATSAYSSQDVRNRRSRDVRAATEAGLIRRQQGRIHQSSIARISSSREFLARESGEGNVDGAQVVAQGLTQKGFLDSCNLGRIFGIAYDSYKKSSEGTSRTGYLYTNFQHGLVRVPLDSSEFANNHNHSPNTYLGRKATALGLSIVAQQTWSLTEAATFMRYSRVRPGVPPSGRSTSSISTHSGERQVASTWASDFGDEGIEIASMSTDHSSRGTAPRIVLGPGRGSLVTSSVAAPPSSSQLFAFGSTRGPLTLDKRDMKLVYSCANSTFRANGDFRDIFAVEFHDNNVLLCGGRPGILSGVDSRTPAVSQRASLIIHPSSITHIKRLDTNRLLVAGLNSTLCQYDRRFCKIDSLSTSLRDDRYQSQSGVTKNILAYPDYRNTARLDLGFDVDLETNLVAAGQETSQAHPYIPLVQLFSLYGGHRLHSPKISTLRPTNTESKVHCLQFVGDFNGRNKSLYIGLEKGIHRFAW